MDTSGKIFALKAGGVPWKEHFFALEKDLQLTGLTYIVFCDTATGTWRVQAIPVDEKATFENR